METKKPSIYWSLLAHFEYHPAGGFVRRKKTANVTYVGQRVLGTKHHTGYRIARFQNKVYPLHRLIFLWHTGFLPPVLDHKDGNRSNNRFENLRPATPSQNSLNSKTQKNNKSSGIKNVYFDKKDGLWYAAIQVRGVRKKFGWSKDKNKTVELARARRKALCGVFENE